MAGIIGLRAEDMEQVDALQRARLEWPNGLPLIRPHVLAPVLVKKGDETVHVPARFGFTRRFASFNAREDKLTTSPFWRKMFGRSHGIVPLSYVVEWLEEGDERRPYLLQRADGQPMMAPALVGPYHDREGETGFAICTTRPNRFFAHFHDRMIGQCTPPLVDRWLSPQGKPEAELLECVHVPDDRELVAVPASPTLQKRQKGDWSPLQTIGLPITWDQLKPRIPRA